MPKQKKESLVLNGWQQIADFFGSANLRGPALG
jgi:hypothetical protein